MTSLESLNINMDLRTTKFAVKTSRNVCLYMYMKTLWSFKNKTHTRTHT